ncbi:MAG: hypothetical protein ACR2OW_15635 [Methyloligellaceae bacterium]
MNVSEHYQFTKLASSVDQLARAVQANEMELVRLAEKIDRQSDRIQEAINATQSATSLARGALIFAAFLLLMTFLWVMFVA